MPRAGRDRDQERREEEARPADPGSPFKEISKQIAPQRKRVTVSTNFHLIIIYRMWFPHSGDTVPSGSAGRKMGKGSN